jgi:hypothetical protein
VALQLRASVPQQHPLDPLPPVSATTVESSSAHIISDSEEAPVPPRREYVWRIIDRGRQSLASVASRIALDLEMNRASSVNRLTWTDARSAHRCAGYVREEITLAATTADSAVVSHDAPSPLEICSVCHEVVGILEQFRCVCGDDSEYIIFCGTHHLLNCGCRCRLAVHDQMQGVRALES